MTSLSGVSGSSSSWPAIGGSSSPGKAKLFAKIDADGDGSIDKTELQSAFDKIAAKTGGAALSADDLFSAIDTDGDGKISSSELADGVKSLAPPPSSTVDFAGRHGGGDLFAKVDSDGNGSLDASELQAMLDKLKGGTASGGASGVTGADLLKKLDTDGDGKVSEAEFKAGRPHGAHHGAGGPPPAAAPAAPAASSSSSSSGSSGDPADSNGDGVVSAQERAAADLKALLAGLASATSWSSDTTSAETSTALSMFA